jgi:transposase-like protein
VVEKAKRRRFTPEYRLKIVRAAEACKDGEIGALLRREGLFSSQLSMWRRQREEGALEGLRARKRGPKAKAVDPRVKKLEQENARLERKLKKADAIIAFQKKVHELLGIPLKPFESEEDD